MINNSIINKVGIIIIAIISVRVCSVNVCVYTPTRPCVFVYFARDYTSTNMYSKQY